MPGTVEEFSIDVGGPVLRGEIARPAGTEGAGPGVVMAHGFSGAHYPALVEALVAKGFTVLDFDFRCYGISDDDGGRVICANEVDDLGKVVGHLAADELVDPERIAVVGSSLGGSIAIAAAARDQRIRAVVAGCPIADGERQLRFRYPDDAEWEVFYRRVRDELDAGVEARDPTDLLDRFDIVEIPPSGRANLPANALMRFSRETVTGFMALKLEPEVGRIEPRPVLILHGDRDPVVAPVESEQLAKAGGPNCTFRLIESDNHFVFKDSDVIVDIATWLGDVMN